MKLHASTLIQLYKLINIHSITNQNHIIYYHLMNKLIIKIKSYKEQIIICNTKVKSFQYYNTAFLDTFWKNPQYKIKLQGSQQKMADDQCSVIISLLQKNNRKLNEELLTTGFAIYKVI